METQLAYCSARDLQVRIAWTPSLVHGGQANLPDAPEAVCLDYGGECTGALCPMFGLPRVLMGIRLARSGLATEPLTTVRAPCPACGRVVDLQLVDPAMVVCPECGAPHGATRIGDGDDSYLALSDLDD